MGFYSNTQTFVSFNTEIVCRRREDLIDYPIGDDSVTTTRARKLIISHIFTAANYEYAIYWIFHQDGVIQLDIKLTGILNTYAIGPDEDAEPWGTEVYPGVNAHNHEHLFCLRLDPNVDGDKNTVFAVDGKTQYGRRIVNVDRVANSLTLRNPATPSDEPVGSEANFYGNAFYPKKTKLETAGTGMSDYTPRRTWDMANTDKLNPYSEKPVSYKLVSREVPGLLPKEGSLVWNRAGFARHAVHVTKYDDEQIYPAGRQVKFLKGRKSHNAKRVLIILFAHFRHVPQQSGKVDQGTFT